MKCPKCKSADLYPTKLESDFSAMGCKSCEGTLVSLLHYRDWTERSALPLDVKKVELKASEEADTRFALTCPKCARLMTKYLITGDQSNRLDLCGSCDEAWIDNGEWELIKSLELTKELPSVFTDIWQIRLRKEVTAKQKYARLEKQVGELDAEKAHEIKLWLKDNKNKSIILQYMGSD